MLLYAHLLWFPRFFFLNHNVIMSTREHLVICHLETRLQARQHKCSLVSSEGSVVGTTSCTKSHRGGGRPHNPESAEGSVEAPPPPASRQAPLVCINVTVPPKSMNKDLFKWELSKCALGASLPPPIKF